MFGTFIYPAQASMGVRMRGMSVVCRITGHSFQETWLFHGDGDLFEVEDGLYCRKCGIVVEENTRNGSGRNGHHGLAEERPIAGAVEN